LTDHSDRQLLEMSTATLHYIYDPLCGWCYAAAPLVEAAHKLPNLVIELHAGGMLSGYRRRPITAQWREFVLPHDQRIAALSGQPFGDAYFDGLLRDTTAVLDSTPPIAAILAVQELSGQGLAMLRRIQRAHYVEGQRVADAAVLQVLAEEIGSAPTTFRETYTRMLAESAQEHITATQSLLARAGGNGFPTFVLDRAGAASTLLDSSPYLSRPPAWAEHLSGLVS
jgi:putative protein-disulfide isomerase